MTPVRVVILAALAMLCATGVAADIIVESRPGGQNYQGYKETAGAWIDSNTPADTSKSSAPGVSPQTLGSRRTTLLPDAGARPDQVLGSARFTPPITTAGDYHIYLTFPRAANATPVTVVIKNASGETKQEMMQDGWGAAGDSNANLWLDLGTYPFAVSADQYVEIQATGATGPADPRNRANLYADAVRFSTDPDPAAIAPAPARPGVFPPAESTQTETPAPAQAAAPPAPRQPPSLPTALPAAANITWEKDLATARAAALAQGKKLLVFFYSPDSSRSADYEKQVLNSSSIKNTIAAGYIAVKVNLETEKELAAQLQVFRAGTINVYDATGNGLDSITDTPEASDLEARLNRF